jgi:hypothetical protein
MGQFYNIFLAYLFREDYEKKLIGRLTPIKQARKPYFPGRFDL